jgi:DNA-binding response OmpR family regulator
VSEGKNRQITVLLVEDDPNDAFLVSTAFQRAVGETTLVHFGDGDSAMRYLAKEAPYDTREDSPKPTMMLLDIKLPKRSGFDVLTWTRGQSNALRRMPILMLTSSGQKSDIDRAFELGATAYLQKPSRPRLLSEMITDLKNFWVKWAEVPEI